ncbi:hypothetical protein BST61_g5977 [Cercospora zeina]
MAPHTIKSAVFLATNLLFLQSRLAFAQEAQAIANPELQQQTVNDTNNNNNDNPIQLTNPSDQTSYISPNSPTTIPTTIPTTQSTSTSSGQLVLCTTLPSDGTNEAAFGASSECMTYWAVTSFTSLTGTAATGGILTASETRSGLNSEATSEMTVTGTTTSTKTETARPTETKTGESGGVAAVRMAGLEVWMMMVLLAGGAVGGAMGL